MSIAVGATGAAVDGHRGVKFPITGGDVTDAPKGSIEHKGGLVFSRNTAEGGVVEVHEVHGQDQRQRQERSCSRSRITPRCGSSTST